MFCNFRSLKNVHELILIQGNVEVSSHCLSNIFLEQQVAWWSRKFLVMGRKWWQNVSGKIQAPISYTVDDLDLTVATSLVFAVFHYFNTYSYHKEYILFQKRSFPDPIEVEMIIPAFEPLPPQYYIRIVSDSWVCSEILVPVSFQHLLLPVRGSIVNDD